MVKKIFSETIFIILTAVALSLLVNSIRADGIRIFSRHNTTQNMGVGAIKDDSKGVKEIRIEDAIQCFNDGNVLFADARSSDDYASGHIKGASNLPVYEFDNWIDAFLSNTENEAKIITYCDGINCELGKDLAENLHLAGFDNVFYLVNGWSRWVENGQPGEMSE